MWQWYIQLPRRASGSHAIRTVALGGTFTTSSHARQGGGDEEERVEYRYVGADGSPVTAVTLVLQYGSGGQIERYHIAGSGIVPRGAYIDAWAEAWDRCGRRIAKLGDQDGVMPGSE